MLLRISKLRIALADHSKFGKQSFAHVGPATDLDILITDSGTDSNHLEKFRRSGY